MDKVVSQEERTYKISFDGRLKGAIGITYQIVARVQAKNEQESLLKLYDDYDHVFRAVVEMVEMMGWTGLTGEADINTRVTGRRFYIIGIGDNLHSFDTEKELDHILKTEEWDDWCCVIANTEEDAKARYDEALNQWRTSIDGVK